jgi:hypothetical protein
MGTRDPSIGVRGWHGHLSGSAVASGEECFGKVSVLRGNGSNGPHSPSCCSATRTLPRTGADEHQSTMRGSVCHPRRLPLLACPAVPWGLCSWIWLVGPSARRGRRRGEPRHAARLGAKDPGGKRIVAHGTTDGRKERLIALPKAPLAKPAVAPGGRRETA